MTPQDVPASRPADPEWMQRKERGSTFWLRVMCLLSSILGRRLSRVVLYGIAGYFLLFAGNARRASQDYLSRVLQRPATLRDLFRHMLYFASTIHDRLYLLRDRHHLFDIDLTGADALHDRHGNHQGVLLFGAHLGSFEVLNAMARHRPGLKMSMAAYPENARRINQALRAINPAAVPDIIPLGTLDAMLTIHGRLAQHAMVGVLADRAAGPDRYARRDFLGAPAPFPTGPFRMAALLGYPVYFMTGIYLGGNRYRIHFELLSEGAPAGRDRAQTVTTLLDRYVAALERHCRAHPYNWFNFYDFWKESETPCEQTH